MSIRDQHGGRRSRPNHFLSVRINNAKIWQEIELVQQRVLSSRPDLQGAVIPVQNLHLTLFVATLSDNDGTLKMAQDVLTSCGDLLVEYGLLPMQEVGYKSPRCANDGKDKPTSASAGLKEIEDRQRELEVDFAWRGPLCLTFEGLGSFSDRVLYACLVEDRQADRLRRLTAAIHARFVESKLVEPSPNDNDFRFTPHLTIMKTSKMHRPTKKSRRRDRGDSKAHIRISIPPDCYDGIDSCFGSHTPAALELSSMEQHEPAPVPEEYGQEALPYYACISRLEFTLNEL
ncbi:unnamed protein product [Choristocarpus tenellus]